MAEARPATQTAPKVDKKQFVANPQAEMIVTKDWVNENRGRKDVIVDTRSAKEFIGEDIRQALRAGAYTRCPAS